MNKDLKEAQKAIVELIIDLHDRPRLFDVKELDSRSLIIWDRILFFWNADAVIRLMANTNEPTGKQWLSAYDTAIYVCNHLNENILARLLIETGNYSVITGLIILYLDKIEAQNEINKRINKIFTLRNFLKFINNPNDQKSFDDFTKHVIDIYNQCAKTLGFQKMRWEDHRQSDYKNEIGAHYWADYKKMQREVNQVLPVMYVRNPISQGMPLIAWDMIAPDIWKKEVIESLRYLSPLSEEEAKQWNSKHFVLKEVIRSLSDERLIKFDDRTLEKYDKTISIKDIHKMTEDKQNNINHSVDYHIFKAGGKRHEINADAILLKIALEEFLKSIRDGARKPDQIIEALTLCVEGKTIAEAARISNISESSVKDYWSMLKFILTK